MCVSKVQHMTGRKTGCNRSRPVFFGFSIFRQTSQLATEKFQNLCNCNWWSGLLQFGSARFWSFLQSSELDLWTLGKLVDILQRLHARALIGLGGPASWIARTYGDNLVQKFMTVPSLQVTFHEKGYFNSKDRKPIFACCNELTPRELDLVFGHICSGGSDQDKWVFPTPELLDELCHH